MNEVGGGDSSEKKDTSEKSDEKWKKNYVPYQEPEEDSNKQPQGEWSVLAIKSYSCLQDMRQA